MNWSELPSSLSRVVRRGMARKGDSRIPGEGQRLAIRALARGLVEHGMLLADDVGMGKTLIACHLAHGVVREKGRVAILAPKGLLRQWREELKDAGTYWGSGMQDMLTILHKNDLFPGDGEVATDRVPIVLLSQTFLNFRTVEDWWDGFLQAALDWKNGAREAVPGNLLPLFTRAGSRVPSEKTCAGGKDPNAFFKMCVLLLLGAFDLVIIDEAHKGRSDASSLSRLLRFLGVRQNSRRLGLTATPIELRSEQWKNTLERLGIPPAAVSFKGQPLRTLVGQLETATEAVRKNSGWKDAAVRDAYRRAAFAFQKALSPYIVRRSKREDDAVQAWLAANARTALSCYAYRGYERRSISFTSLSPEWQEAVCAAESCSLTAKRRDADGEEDPRRIRLTQRARLTIGNGHGMAQDDRDALMGLWLEKARHPSKEAGEREEADRKRHARLSFWIERLRPVSGDAALFCHPQLNEAADMVLNIAERGEKVLVFGAYTRPMRAFTLLLNAHAMLTTLSCRERGEKKFWPQPSWPGEGLPALALVAALKSERQRFWKGSRAEDIRQRLASQYREYRRDLIHLRSRIHGLLQEKLPLPCGFGQFIDLFTRWLEEELGFEKAEALDGEGILLKCRELGARITGRESPDEVNIDSRTADLIRNGLTDESDFGSPRSAFARMMDGRTPRTVRYALQDAFNRPASRLRVLVTQSMVGREGLNLHRACRHIFRLHPQWNPGYAEQEIGRIDRIASLWSRKVLGSEGEKQDISAQLGVSCIVFEGTYEAFRWHVLTERSAMLHGQLYGDPLPDILPETEEEKEWIREIVRAAPSFSPLKEEREERIPDEHR